MGLKRAVRYLHLYTGYRNSRPIIYERLSVFERAIGRDFRRWTVSTFPTLYGNRHYLRWLSGFQGIWWSILSEYLIPPIHRSILSGPANINGNSVCHLWQTGIGDKNAEMPVILRLNYSPFLILLFYIFLKYRTLSPHSIHVNYI